MTGSSRYKTISLAAALVGLVFLAHGLALWGTFIWDDLDLIVRSPLIHASDGLWRYWFTTQAPDYFPLTSTTWWVEWRVWGEHPAGYHLVNLLLHAFSAVILWRILSELEIPGAWLAAAIWAVHPVQVESVAWIAERKNALSTALAAASVLLLLQHFRRDQLRNYVWALVMFTAALLAKTAVAPLAVVVPFCGLRCGRSVRRAVLEAIPFVLIAAVLCAVTIFFQSHRAIASDVVRTDRLPSRIAIAGRAVWFYLGKLIWPQPLAFVYPRWQTGEVSFRAFVPLILLLLAFLILWLGRRQWGWGPLAALAYFVLMLLPVLGLINIYFMRYSLVADHWQYAASIGPIALLAAAISRANRVARHATGTGIIVLLMIASQRQALLYHNAQWLWRDTIAKNPTAWMAWMNLGHTLAGEGRYAQAQESYRRAALLAPKLADPHYSMATIDAEQGRYADAAVEYQQAIEIDPNVSAFYMDMGHSLAEMNQLDRALACFERAIELKPSDANQQFQLGALLEQINRPSEAIGAYRAAVSLQPNWAQARVNLARTLLAQGRREEAAEQYEWLLRSDPNLLLARVGLQATKAGP